MTSNDPIHPTADGDAYAPPKRTPWQAFWAGANPKEQDPVTWVHVTFAIVASLVIFGGGFLFGSSGEAAIQWASFGAAGLTALGLSQFLVGYWADTSDRRAAEMGLPMGEVERIKNQNNKIRSRTSWVWYVGLVAAVLLAGVVAGAPSA